MNKYFIVCEYEYEDGSSFYEVLTGYNPVTEISEWNVTDDSSSGMVSFLDYYIKESDGREEPPYFFDSEKEAKKTVEILKAHDDPNRVKKEGIKSVIYYVVFSATQTVPTKFIDLMEV